MVFAGKEGGQSETGFREAYWMKEGERDRLRSVHAELSPSAQTQSHHLIEGCNKFRCSGCTS
jgi:hypothetical protein